MANEKMIKEMQEEAYNKGLEDGRNEVWELSKKLIHFEYEGGFSDKEIHNIFDCDEWDCVFDAYTPQEALAKLKAYEEAKMLTRGDEVICLDTDEKAIYLGKSDGSSEGWFLISGYDVPQRILLEEVKKTGRHLYIFEILEQIREV